LGLPAFERVASWDWTAAATRRRNAMVSTAARLAKRFKTAICVVSMSPSVDGGDGALGFMLDALGGIVDEYSRGINHGLRCGFAPCRGCFLRAQQAGLHRVDFHDHVRKRADQFLFVSQLLAEFLDRASSRCRNIFLALATTRDSAASTPSAPPRTMARPVFHPPVSWPRESVQAARPSRASLAFE